MSGYPFAEIEKKWQDRWAAEDSFRAKIDRDKEKYFVFCACPYVSGNLHMGHVRSYTLGDVCARFERMNGKNVLWTLGFDTTGLPAEVAAKARGLHPREWVEEGVAKMKDEMLRLGLSLDLKRSFSSAGEEVFRRHQELFLILLDNGFVYQKTAMVNWCRVCDTTIANSQVEEDGTCWRCHEPVEGRRVRQWFYRMSAFSEDFYTGLDELDWAESSKTHLRNWSDKKEGTLVDFPLEGLEGSISSFTSTVSFLYTVSFLAVSAEHPLAQSVLDGTVPSSNGLSAEQRAEAATTIEEIGLLPPVSLRPDRAQLRGCDTGYRARNPLSGALLPIFVADFVNPEVGTGVVMGNPTVAAEDMRFATKYGIEYQEAFEGALSGGKPDESSVLTNSGVFSSLTVAEAKPNVLEELQCKGQGEPAVLYGTKDWLVSRQRYWGVPIPIIHCEECGPVPVPKSDLPVELPEQVDPFASGNPLGDTPEFLNVDCPKCGRAAQREPDTLDCIVDAFWQYCGPTSPQDEGELFDREEFEYWMPADMAFYGTDILRFTSNYQFFLYALHAIGMFPSREPFLHTVHHEMVLKDGRKMSKSLGNTVDPNEALREYGADALRLYMVSAMRATRKFNYSDEGIQGVVKVLGFLWELGETCHELKAADDSLRRLELEHIPAKWRKRMLAAREATVNSYRAQNYHYAAESVFRLLRFLRLERKDLADPNRRGRSAKVLVYGCSLVVQLLSPIAPHICAEIAQRLGDEPPEGPAWSDVKERRRSSSYAARK